MEAIPENHHFQPEEVNQTFLGIKTSHHVKLEPKKMHCLSLWHKVDIRFFQCHKIVNFCDNLVGLMNDDCQLLKKQNLGCLWNYFLHPLIWITIYSGRGGPKGSSAKFIISTVYF